VTDKHRYSAPLLPAYQPNVITSEQQVGDQLRTHDPCDTAMIGPIPMVRGQCHGNLISKCMEACCLINNYY